MGLFGILFITITDLCLSQRDTPLLFTGLPNLDSGWITNPANQHQYKVISCGSWTNCNAAAQNVGAHLVSIGSTAEQAWLINQFGATWYWIGLTDAATEGRFVWTTGEPVTFTSWGPGEPNNSSSNINGEDYIAMNVPRPGMWNDSIDNPGDINPEDVTRAIIERGIDSSEVFPPNGNWPTGWTTPTTSYAPWTVTNADPAQEGRYSLRSGAISDSQKSQVEVSGNFQAGTISFARRVSSESNYDALRFSVDGVMQGEWSGEQAWSVVSYPLAAGTHTLRWSYEKDVSLAQGSDAAWIDAVSLPPSSSVVTISNLVVLQAGSPSKIGGGPGDDIYLLTPTLLTGAQSFTITDVQGNNRLQLAGGLGITASEVTANALRLTLSSGTQIDILGADRFGYDVCGNITVVGNKPSTVTFASFALDTLRVAIPISGTAVGGAVTITCP